MGDTRRRRPDHRRLFERASTQHGWFTSADARACGFAWDLLTHHVRGGRFVRLRRGVYRLRDYPSSPHDEVVAAWLSVGTDVAVVSHVSALDLLDLSDLIPDAVHLTVPRARRHRPALPGVQVHTTTRPLRADEVVVVDGLRVTSAARTIADVAQGAGQPEQVEMAVAQALARGMATRDQLVSAARARGPRARRMVERAVRAAP